MPRYIDANAALKLILARIPLPWVLQQEVREILKHRIVCADVQEVKHGHWIKSQTDRCYCSICHEVRPYYFKETLDNMHAGQKGLSLINWECPYCPNCGAKMDEEECV